MPEAALLRPNPVELVTTDPAERPDVALRAVSAGAPGLAPAIPRLEIPDYDLSAALALRRQLGVSHVLAQILVRRGLSDPAAARAFLDPQDAHDPSAFAGIDLALALIERHIARGSRITVHGDYDVDGVCATAIMVRALRARGADVGWFLPARVDDGYGLSLETVRRLAARGTELLITVDCAITAVEEVAAARAAGLEVVVSDHHAPRADGRLPDCPVVHPGACGYPFAELCGSAVALKLAQALGAPTAGEDLELAGLATVADLMPLRGEDRIAWEAQSQIAKLGERSAFVLAGEGWHPGVIGIVASRVVERYHRPAVLIALDGSGPAQGSARSISGFDLLAALRATGRHLERYGGHTMAAGLTVRPDRVHAFGQAFESHAQEVLTPDLLEPVERVDAIVSGSELGLPLAEELELLEPCGTGNPRGRLYVPGARFGDIATMGEGRHARFSVTSGGTRARAVAFGCEGRLPAK